MIIIIISRYNSGIATDRAAGRRAAYAAEEKQDDDMRRICTGSVKCLPRESVLHLTACLACSYGYVRCWRQQLSSSLTKIPRSICSPNWSSRVATAIDRYAFTNIRVRIFVSAPHLVSPSLFSATYDGLWTDQKQLSGCLLVHSDKVSVLHCIGAPFVGTYHTLLRVTLMSVIPALQPHSRRTYKIIETRRRLPQLGVSPCGKWSFQQYSNSPSSVIRYPEEH
ncbi:hypothetical protein BJ878DRAFT_490328 [Calycina marina]|uniref:Uncharacterized protein n=1 Tax=Calycina marina TaxID=1763456 RepID=A0A9P8CI51_9HELO|nr:hypothetical protein BJ878DRAFT_490328 [Calycina marina]